MSEKKLLQSIGKNYESYVLNKNNHFNGITLITEIEIDVKVVRTNFPLFNNYPINVDDDFKKPFAPISENKYEYFFKNKTKLPFKINTISETEHAPQFGATWESKYIWVLFNWVLIKKENKGIS